MAQFGVTTAMVSLVLSAFMGGLGLGSWGAALIVRKYGAQFSALRFYAMMELLIGVSAVAVPAQLVWGRDLLLQVTRELSVSSPIYYIVAGIWLTITLAPWCICMGATFPFAMASIRRDGKLSTAKSFSYLYLANVFGATVGAVIPLFLIELLGFHHTLRLGALFNILLAASAFSLSFSGKPSVIREMESETCVERSSDLFSDNALIWLLFGTGVTSMGAEVVWVRLYTPSLSTVVYAFAAILGLYLVAMDIGSWLYRHLKRDDILENGLIWVLLGVSVVVPFLSADPRLRLPAVLRVLLGITPFSFLVGFITPALLDRFSGGNPDRAGRAYAVNIAGCVLGPLVSGFLLLPLVGERFALCAFALPWFLAGLKYRPRFRLSFRNVVRSRYVISFCLLMLGSIAVALSAKGFEEQYEPREVRRDRTATIVATGSTRAGKRLLVNGVGITNLTPVTKMMVHLPNAFLPRPPKDGLVICFGMGTTHLSMLSWGISSTAVELVPRVPDLVTFFHPNAALLMKSQLSHVVIDDGRLYLERSSQQYDVITIDPPPPVEAAGSSLLYSKEFYSTLRGHLSRDGILQQWLPLGDSVVVSSVARALKESFPHVRVFHSVEGWGFHFLASANPIPHISAADLAAKLPPDAARDLMEWGPASSPQEQFGIVLKNELAIDDLIHAAPNAPALQDDLPINEYFILRRLHDPDFQRRAVRRLLRRSGEQ